MSTSPILHFLKEEVSEEVIEPELVFVHTCSPESPIVVEDDVKELGSFHLEDADFCSFVLSRGHRKGEMCGKIQTHSLMLERVVPACIQHLNKYEEIKMLQSSSFLSPRTTYPLSYIEYNSPEPSPSTKPKRQKKVITLDSIPKAIERSRECTVCLEDQNPLVLPCGHTVCFECVTQLKKELCPMCRKPFKKETDLYRL